MILTWYLFTESDDGITTVEMFDNKAGMNIHLAGLDSAQLSRVLVVSGYTIEDRRR